MKKYLATILIICQYSTLFAQCGVPQNTFSNNVYFFSANLNWDNANNIHHYKIRYKVINTSPWSYKNNIDSLLTSKVLNNLVDNSTYIWQIRSHCDTLNNNYSNIRKYPNKFELYALYNFLQIEVYQNKMEFAHLFNFLESIANTNRYYNIRVYIIVN